MLNNYQSEYRRKYNRRPLCSLSLRCHLSILYLSHRTSPCSEAFTAKLISSCPLFRHLSSILLKRLTSSKATAPSFFQKCTAYAVRMICSNLMSAICSTFRASMLLTGKASTVFVTSEALYWATMHYWRDVQKRVEMGRTTIVKTDHQFFQHSACPSAQCASCHGGRMLCSVRTVRRAVLYTITCIVVGDARPAYADMQAYYRETRRSVSFASN